MVHCLFSPVYVSLRFVFESQKTRSDNEFSLFANGTYSIYKNFNFNNKKQESREQLTRVDAKKLDYC